MQLGMNLLQRNTVHKLCKLSIQFYMPVASASKFSRSVMNDTMQNN